VSVPSQPRARSAWAVRSSRSGLFGSHVGATSVMLPVRSPDTDCSNPVSASSAGARASVAAPSVRVHPSVDGVGRRVRSGRRVAVRDTGPALPVVTASVVRPDAQRPSTGSGVVVVADKVVLDDTVRREYHPIVDAQSVPREDVSLVDRRGRRQFSPTSVASKTFSATYVSVPPM